MLTALQQFFLFVMTSTSPDISVQQFCKFNAKVRMRKCARAVMGGGMVACGYLKVENLMHSFLLPASARLFYLALRKSSCGKFVVKFFSRT